MFKWDKSTDSINIPACEVVNLFRSMREVQLALPSVSSQQASAYLCQYKEEGGVKTVAVFHLHKSQVLAFYFSEPRLVPVEKIDSMLDQGLNFVESMGFLMTDQDLHLLDDADQEMLWGSLPIKSGVTIVEELPPVVTPVTKYVEKHVESLVEKVEAASVAAVVEAKKEVLRRVAESKAMKAASTIENEKLVTPATAKAEATENVDDLLAAVEAMRAKRPGLRARRTLPPKDEMERRRLQLQESIGRILASL